MPLFTNIGHKIIAVVGASVTVGLIAIGFFYAKHQESNIMAQNERTMLKVTESVIQGLQTVMVAGYADIAQAFADRLKQVPEVVDFRILRRDGSEAFRDNQTINDVNNRIGDEEFEPRDVERQVPVLAPTNRELIRLYESQKTVSYYEVSAEGEKRLTYLAPIINSRMCYNCHGSGEKVRGILKLTTSLAPIREDIHSTWIQSTIVIAIAITFTIILTGFMIRRSVVNPIAIVTSAMARASDGDLTQEIPILGRDELGRMAGSFNSMIRRLLDTYTGLRLEQDKLSTIILSAREGMVVTDGHGKIVLINPAAESLLAKGIQEVIDGGFENLFDQPEQMRAFLERTVEDQKPELINYKGRILSVYASTIRTKGGDSIGSAALIRDVTEEKRLEESLIKMSTTDALTELFNRRFLDDTLNKEWLRSKRYGTPLSVLMMDVDFFKKFNDKYGHDQGDRVLQAVAKILRDTLRKIDYPCRYGGEEFMAILTNTPREGAMIVAERLRRLIEEAEIDGLRVTVSIGISSYPEIDHVTLEQFVEIADAALYRSKERGRNCCTFGSANQEESEKSANTEVALPVDVVPQS